MFWRHPEIYYKKIECKSNLILRHTYKLNLMYSFKHVNFEYWHIKIENILTILRSLLNKIC